VRPNAEGDITLNRPTTWLRNDQISLNPSVAARLEELIPDAIERGIFTESLRRYNSSPESRWINLNEREIFKIFAHDFFAIKRQHRISRGLQKLPLFGRMF
jgi:hypothetical protein